jgi:hypothetical protein
MLEKLGDWFTKVSRSELQDKINGLESGLKTSFDTNEKLYQRTLKAERELRQLKNEEKVMASGTELCGCLPLETACPFYVKETKPNDTTEYFVTRGGRKTYEETLKVAQGLAVQYPQNTYSVVGVLASVKAEIPIATTIVAKPVAQEKVDTEKKD